MRPESFNVILENTQSDQKHLCRLFLFAQASCLKDDELEHIRLQIQNRLGYSDPQFFEAMQQTTLEWQNKLTRLELEAQSLPALEAFEKKYSRTDPVVMAQMRSYLAKVLSVPAQDCPYRRVTPISNRKHSIYLAICFGIRMNFSLY